MNNFTIEPLNPQDNLKVFKLNQSLINQDLSFQIKCNNCTLGYTLLRPMHTCDNSKAVWLQNMICTDDKNISIFMKEILMRSWEMGFDVIFADFDMNIPKNLGFVELDRSNINLHVTPNKVLAMELSWNGLEKFKKLN